jgi:hypothetical protein
MLKDISRSRLVGFWFAAVTVTIAGVVVMGVNVGASTSALLLILSFVPPAILFFVWRGAPPPTVGEILYSANTPTETRFRP